MSMTMMFDWPKIVSMAEASTVAAPLLAEQV